MNSKLSIQFCDKISGNEQALISEWCFAGFYKRPKFYKNGMGFSVCSPKVCPECVYLFLSYLTGLGLDFGKLEMNYVEYWHYDPDRCLLIERRCRSINGGFEHATETWTIVSLNGEQADFEIDEESLEENAPASDTKRIKKYISKTASGKWLSLDTFRTSNSSELKEIYDSMPGAIWRAMAETAAEGKLVSGIKMYQPMSEDIFDESYNDISEIPTNENFGEDEFGDLIYARDNAVVMYYKPTRKEKKILKGQAAG